MMTFLRQWTLRVASFALTGLYTLYRVHPAVWRLMARNYRPWMGRFARLHAWMTCQFAGDRRARVRRLPAPQRLAVPLVRAGVLPAHRQAGYVKAYPEEQRCRGGQIEIVGSVVDESSGSSGQPFNWVRSRRELRSVHKNLAGYTTMVFPSQAPVRHQRVLDGRLGHRHEHRHRDGADRDGEEHRPGPAARSSTRCALRARLRLHRHRVPAVPQAPARPARRRGLPLGRATASAAWSAARG